MVIITCFVFSFSVCYLDISFFLSIIRITFTISFRSEKNRSNVNLSVNELSSSETRLISTSSGIVMALALKTKKGNKLNANRQNTIGTNGQPSAQLFPKR